jgi:hypothetical protein
MVTTKRRLLRLRCFILRLRWNTTLASYNMYYTTEHGAHSNVTYHVASHVEQEYLHTIVLYTTLVCLIYLSFTCSSTEFKYTTSSCVIKEYINMS